MSKWQPIETAPRDGKPVLIAVSDPYEVYQALYEPQNEWDKFPWRTPDNRWAQHAITHWMPLPEPPR